MDLSLGNISKKFFGAWQGSEQTGKQVVRGGFIIFFERFIIKILYFIRTVILARLLFPNDFGLFGLATLIMTIPETFLQHGMTAAIVQRQSGNEQDNKECLDSVWTINWVKNIFLAAFLFFVAAPFGASFFHNSDVLLFARALAIIYLFTSLESLGVILLQKEMKFNRQFFYDISGVIAEVVVGISAAFIFKNAWALMAGMAANRATYMVVSYLVHPYRPSLNFNWNKLKELFHFGKWIGFGGIVTFFVSQGDNLVVGKMLDVSSLGIYQIAFALATLPAVELARSLNSILFPLYAKIQSDKLLLNVSFIKIARLVFALIIPASFGLVVLAKEIVFFIYGERWLAMVPILCVVVLYAFFKALDYLINPLFAGIGKPQTTVLISIFQAAVMFLLVVPLVKIFGALGAALATTGGICLAELILLLRLKKEINLSFLAMAKVIILPVLGSLIMSGLIFFAKQSLPADNLLLFISYIILGILIYAGAIFLLDKISGRRFYESFLWIKKNV